MDMRHISIIDEFPFYNYNKDVLDVGCGKGEIINWLHMEAGCNVIGTDIVKDPKYPSHLPFYNLSIFDMDGFKRININGMSVVLCCEVLEHLKDYKIAVKNLLSLTDRRLIIGIPYKKSFNDTRPAPLGHCNFWDESNINEFITLCKPYSVGIRKIRTKREDVEMNQWSYVITVDKRQDLC